jgi:hypothetical protein
MGRRRPWSVPRALLAVLATCNVEIFTVSRVSARRLSCAGARRFVRTWERLADHGKLSSRADGKVRNGVLVYYRPK